MKQKMDKYRNYMKDYMRKRKAAGLGPSKEYHRTYTKDLRRRVMAKIGGEKCCECSCDILSILEINHINGGGHQERKKESYTYKGFLRDIIFERVDIKQFNVLCIICNAKHRVEMLGIKGFEVKYIAP